MYNNKKSWDRERSPRNQKSDNSERKPFRKSFDKKNSTRSFDDRKKEGWNKEKQVQGGDTWHNRAHSYSKRNETNADSESDFRPRRTNTFAPKAKDSFYDKKVSRKSYSEDYDPNAKYNKKKQIEYNKNVFSGEMRLNRFLANAGICSRREADDFIQAGVVSVNGKVVSELGTKVKITDIVKFHDQTVKVERKVYLLLNKPKDCVTTVDDPQGRMSVMDLVKNACNERIYPVGRLDKNTTGVLLLTNDGELTAKLTHPKYDKKKIYHAFLDKPMEEEDMQKILSGIELEDGEIHADAIEYVDETDARQVGIEIHSGKNRIVRRIFDHLGYTVLKLDRVYFAGLTKKNLPRGRYRFLTPKELTMLQMGAYE